MEIPDLSLRNTFSPPLLLKDQPKTSTCTVCKHTYADLERGHRVDSVVDTRDYPHRDEYSQITCDSDSLVNRGRISVKSEDGDSICSNCRRQQQEIAALEALRRDEEQAKQQSLTERKEESPKRDKERLSEKLTEDHDMHQQEREGANIDNMPHESTEEPDTAISDKEQEDLARTLEASCVLNPADQNVMVNKKVCIRPAFS
jgi:predicted Fe-S protein YdhL (DUF1289 family)